MIKQASTGPNEETQEEIYVNLTRMLSRMDIASNSYELSTVAMQCDEKLLEEFLNEKPSSIGNLKDFLQSHLYTASFWGFPDFVNILISYGADVNYRNKDSLWTPLHAACFQENEKVVEILLRKGASVRSKDRCGRTSVDIASVSAKIWPYFQHFKCEKTPVEDLIKKKVLKRQTEPHESYCMMADGKLTKQNKLPGGYTSGRKHKNESCICLQGSRAPSSRSSSSSSQMRMLLGGDNQAMMAKTTSKISSLQLG